MKLQFAEPKSKPTAETLVFLVGEDKAFSPSLSALDKAQKGLVTAALKHSKFTGKKGQGLNITLAPGAGASRALIMGVGKATDAKALTFEQIGGAMVPHLNSTGNKTGHVVVELPKASKVPPAVAAAHMALGARLRAFNFDKYFTTKKAEEKPTLQAVTLLVAKPGDANKHFTKLDKIADGVEFTRNLVSEPANIINPETLAEACKTLTKLGVEVKVIGEAEMKKLGMHSLLGVGQGSDKESKTVIMRYNGASKKSATPIAFVGKGVTFDTGGISIKPAGGMEEMKWDMGGAGVVIGLMKALAGRKAKINVVGAVGLVENMPDGNAQRPGDVVKSMSGQTIEVLNTDAEGRLVLADVLWYTQVNYKPRLIVDLATLTGAIIVALGSSRAGLFSNNDKLSEQLYDAGVDTAEPVWRLPLGDEYDKQINSDIADMQNIGKEREAGSITAAQFLQRFIKNGTPWAHLDIAGVAWSKRDADTCPKGATAFGVRLLDHFVTRYYEEK